MLNMTNTNLLNVNKKNNIKKIPNLKEFVKYLDQTLKLFDNHIAEKDFENKNSDVYKLFPKLLTYNKKHNTKSFTKISKKEKNK